MATLSASFETADLSEFDSTVTDSGDLSAHADAAYNGSYGMQAVLDDNTVIYGQWTFANKKTLRIGFWFNPNGFDVVDDMIIAAGGSMDDDWHIRFLWDGASLKVYAMVTNDAAGWSSSSQATITDDWHWIEVLFVRSSAPGANDGTIDLWVDTVDGTPDASASGLDDDTQDYDNVCVGAASIAAPITETLYFDDVRVNDTGDAIGPTGEVSAAVIGYAVLSKAAAATAEGYAYLQDSIGCRVVVSGVQVVVSGVQVTHG